LPVISEQTHHPIRTGPLFRPDSPTNGCENVHAGVSVPAKARLAHNKMHHSEPLPAYHAGSDATPNYAEGLDKRF